MSVFTNDNVDITSTCFPQILFDNNNRPNKSIQKAATKKLAKYYNMKHPKRGQALIFNHEFFEDKKLKQRTGTNVDCQNLKLTLQKVGFEVKDYHNFNYKQIVKVLEAAAKADHSEEDCLFVAVLSHGNWDMMYAHDKCYKNETLMSNFTADKCPTLAGKPKLFLIQACQNEDNSNVFLQERSVTDGLTGQQFRIPIQADFLIAYSSVPINMKIHRKRPAEVKNELKKKKFLKNSCKDAVDGNMCVGSYQVDTPSDEETIDDDDFNLCNTNGENCLSETCSCDLHHETKGSLFIQAFCKQLRQNGTIYDIQTLLTYAIRSVVLNYQNPNGEITQECEKQLAVPYFSSMLTRILQFNEKKIN